MLTKQQIIDAKDYNVETVDCPEWGGQVGMRALTGKERDVFADYCIKLKIGNELSSVSGITVKLLSMVIVDENGNNLFTEADLSALNNKAAKVLNKLFEKAQKMNGLTETSAKSIEKN